MIQRLLLAAALIFGSNAAFAQFYAPAYPFSIGVYGGIAPTTRIYRSVDFSADQKSLPNIFGIVGHYNITDRLQVGLDIGTASEWSALGVTTINGLNGQVLGQPGVRYVYAERSWTVQARVNGMVPIYDRMKEMRSNFYYGFGAGVISTINDGGNKITQLYDQPGPEYQFISEYRYEPAIGYTVGFQVGMEWWAVGRMGVNVEFAPRFNHLNTVDNRNNSRNGPFDLFTFPLTAGIRYRFGPGSY